MWAENGDDDSRSRRSTVRSVVQEVFVDDADSDSDCEPAPVVPPGGDLRLPWLWVEGWRARLRRSGDIVEQTRWEWRLDHTMRANSLPVIVATTPGRPVGMTGEEEREREGRRRVKSVHWA